MVDLSEFLYRFRIENEMWHALANGPTRRGLTGEERRHVEHYRG